MTPFVIEERWDEQSALREQPFPSLERAQADALHSLAADLAETLRSLISQGILTVENGHVIVKNGHPPKSSED